MARSSYSDPMSEESRDYEPSLWERIIFWVFVGASVLGLIYSCDNSAGGEGQRSGLHRTERGLHVRIDARTGCHYILSPDGDLVPRVRKDGTHVCTGFPDNQTE